MIVTIIKDGVAAAIKMWNIMGALTGVAFGAITSFYFTKAVNQEQFAQLRTGVSNANAQLDVAASTAKEADLSNEEKTQKIMSIVEQASAQLKSLEESATKITIAP